MELVQCSFPHRRRGTEAVDADEGRALQAWAGFHEEGLRCSEQLIVPSIVRISVWITARAAKDEESDYPQQESETGRGILRTRDTRTTYDAMVYNSMFESSFHMGFSQYFNNVDEVEFLTIEAGRQISWTLSTTAVLER